MTWNEYLEVVISRGATPELAQNSIGHMMDLYESYEWEAQVPFDADPDLRGTRYDVC